MFIQISVIDVMNYSDLFKMDWSATKHKFSMKMICFDNEKHALELSYTPIFDPKCKSSFFSSVHPNCVQKR